MATDNFGYLLQRLAFLLQKQSDQVLHEQLGIGFTQFKILMILVPQPAYHDGSDYRRAAPRLPGHILDVPTGTPAVMSRQPGATLRQSSGHPGIWAGALGWRSNCGQKVIADKLGQTEAAISRQVKLLKEGGFLITIINPKNRREHLTIPTPKGERITEKAMELVNKHHAPMLDLLSDKQREKLLESLNIMHDYVSRTEKPILEN